MKQGVWCLAERLDDQSLLTEILISLNYCGQATNRCSLRFPIIHANQISPINPLNTFNLNLSATFTTLIHFPSIREEYFKK